MSTNFPTSLDSLTNPASSDTLDSPSHSSQHANVNDAIEALEAKVGVDSSAVATSLDYKVAHRLVTTNNLSDLGSASTARTNLGLAIGSDVQAYDSHYLKSNASADLTAGFYMSTPYANGTKSSGTFTPDPANGPSQTATNGGAHTLGVPTNACTIVIEYTNNGSAGSITTSGFTQVDGDSLDTTDTHVFLFFITKTSTKSLLTVKAMQ